MRSFHFKQIIIVIFVIHIEAFDKNTTVVDSKFYLRKGLVVTAQNTKLLHNSENNEILKLSISYPFKPTQIQKYRFHELPKCAQLLANFDQMKIQESVDSLFKNGELLLKTRFSGFRAKRQAMPIFLGIASSFAFKKVLEIFDFRKHEIDTTHLTDVIQKLTCEIISAEDKLFEIKVEQKSRHLVEKHFDFLKGELSNLQHGSLRNTNLRNIFNQYCQKANSIYGCENYIEYSNNAVRVIDYGFNTNRSFILHAELKIPNLKHKYGVLYNIQPVYIPKFNTASFIRPKISGNFIQIQKSDEFFEQKNCVGNQEKVFICEKSSFFENELSHSFNLTYEIQNTKKFCHLTILDNNVVFCNKISATQSTFLNLSIESKVLPAGIHWLPRKNYVFTCGDENHKSFAQKYRSIKDQINLDGNSSIILAENLFDENLIVEKHEFFKNNYWEYSFSVLIFCQTCGIMVISVYFYQKLDAQKKVLIKNIESSSIKTI